MRTRPCGQCLLAPANLVRALGKLRQDDGRIHKIACAARR
jgi:hypothetical protein